MNVPSDNFGVESLNSVVEFLRTELSVALISASLAEEQRKSGHNEAAKTSMADAEERYSALMWFLLEPNSAKLMKIGEQAQFASALKRLRKKLDSLTV
jgi:hypothetical protein